MPRGPLPTSPETRRRTNAPTIPTTELPAAGRAGRPPTPPAWVKLGADGKAWWNWAWHTPQAAGWAKGHEGAVARRAQLEDDLAALEIGDGGLDLAELLDVEPSERTQFVKAVISRLHSLAAGRLAVLKQCTELEDRLGLNPKAMANLRWTIKAPQADAAVPAGVTAIGAYRDALG